MTTSSLYRRSRIPAILLAAVGSLWFLAAHFWQPPRTISVLPVTDLSLHKGVQVVVRTTPTNSAGIGAVVAQLRSGAAIATMLGASFTTFSVESEHTYHVASLLHLDLLETRLDRNTRVCSLMASPHHGRIVELIGIWCDSASQGDAHALELQGLFSGCDIVLDDRPWDVRYDMSKCTWRWVKHVFSTLGTKKAAKGHGIGLHIRWGDMANDTAYNDPRTQERSTPIDVAARLLHKLRECGVQDELSVYMESHNTTMLKGLGEPYRIVDTGDDIGDLVDLASNRLLILDISSYTVLAHQIADGGISVVPDIDSYGITWHDNGKNHVLRWHELLSITCSDLSTLFSS